jgi:NAD(P)-dependent dehydrogenase (short-subunit alcohol dehydrogenase family)
MDYLCFAPLGPIVSVGSTCFRGCCESLLPCPLKPVYSLCTACCGEEEGVYVITGGNRGVGYHTTRILLQQNHRVIILSRNAQNGEQAVKDLQKSTGNDKIEYHTLDLASIESVFTFVKFMEQKNVPVISLINNAGLISADAMKVNHIGHFVLTLGLLPFLQSSVDKNGYARVVNVASCAHFDGSAFVKNHIDDLLNTANNNNSSTGRGNNWSAYSASKAANVLFSYTLARHLENHGITVSSYHPGVMMTDLWRSPEEHKNSNSNSHNNNLSTPVNNSNNTINNNTRSNDEAQSRRAIRCLGFCCVKHPMVSAAGLSSLATPRCECRPLRRCKSARNGDSYSYCMDLGHTLCAGGNGGYFQQCFCCSVIPVRPAPSLTGMELQELLWTNSLLSVERENPVLGEYLREIIRKLDIGGLKEKKCGDTVSPAWPCTECLSFGPYCVCVACLC